MNRLYVSLSSQKSMDKLIKSLEAYKQELHDKTERFVSRLIDVGIETAEINAGKYKGYIVFKKVLDPDSNGCEGVLIATDGHKIVKEWYTDKNRTNKRSYEVSPILLAEFGSGWLADAIYNIPGVGQGTMPNSYGHATDEDGWYWYDENGVQHYSIGEAPTYPMRSAMLAMQFEVDRIGREVFGNG